MKFDDEPAFASVRALNAAFRTHALSPVELTRHMLDRIGTIDRDLNSYCILTPELAIQQARQSEDRWMRGTPQSILDGVPTSIKDTFLTADIPTWRGSWNAVWPPPLRENAPSVDLVVAAGMVVLGKTTTPEFGWKGTTDSKRFGVTRNPHQLDRTPGGSSGGAAAAISAGLSGPAVGSDGAGSIRIPASFCGLVGLKPTYGRVPFYPDSPFSALTYAGPLARSVDDARALFSILDKPDSRDPTSVFPRCAAVLQSSARVAYVRSFGGLLPESEVATCLDRGVSALQACGIRVELCELDLEDAPSLFLDIYASAADAATAAWGSEQWDRADAGLLRLAAYARETVDRRSLQKAWLGARGIARRISDLLTQFDFLVTPTMPLTAFEIGRDMPPDREGDCWMSWSPYTYPFNLSGHPACSLPVGFDSSRMPVGMQIVGQHHADSAVLALAEMVEKELSVDNRPRLRE